MDWGRLGRGRVAALNLLESCCCGSIGGLRSISGLVDGGSASSFSEGGGRGSFLGVGGLESLSGSSS